MATLLTIQISCSFSMESPGVCFVIGISVNKKIHFADHLQDLKALLLTFFWLSVMLPREY